MLAPFTRRVRGIHLLLVLSSLSLTVPVHGQLGALRRAAERRVEQSAEDRAAVASLIPPGFDGTTIEITTERLDKYQVAMGAMRSQRAAARQRYDEMQTRAAAFRDSAQRVEKPKERQAYEKAYYRYTECRGTAREALEAESERKVEEMTERMQRDPLGAQRDPKMKAFFAVLNEAGAAVARGDTAAATKAQSRLVSMFGTEIDSASLDKAAVPKCGTRPAIPASMAQSSAFMARSAVLEKEATELLATAGRVTGASVGMSDRQARMFWERIQSWLNGMNTSAPISVSFTRAEYDLLLSRRNELRKVFSGSE